MEGAARMIFRQSEKEYWYELKIFNWEWNRPKPDSGKKFLKEIKERVPKNKRRFIKRKNIWLIHVSAKAIAEELIAETWGGQESLEI